MSEVVIPLTLEAGEGAEPDISLRVYLEYAKQPLYTGSNEIRDKLSATITSSQPTLALVYGNIAVQDGIRLSCELEDMYVWQATPSIQVARGQFGTLAAEHLAESIVYIAPKFSDAEILREINNELRDLSAPGSGLFAVRTLSFTTLSARVGYELLPVIAPESILEIRARVPGTADAWQLVNRWDFQRKADTGDFPSSYALFIYDPLPVGVEVEVKYSTAFSLLTALSELVLATSGLPATALDIPLLGAAIRLTSGREIRRNFDESQGDTRRAAEVPPGANLNAAGGLRANYLRRVRAEANRLYRLYPARKRRNWNLI